MLFTQNLIEIEKGKASQSASVPLTKVWHRVIFYAFHAIFDIEVESWRDRESCRAQRKGLKLGCNQVIFMLYTHWDREIQRRDKSQKSGLHRIIFYALHAWNLTPNIEFDIEFEKGKCPVDKGQSGAESQRSTSRILFTSLIRYLFLLLDRTCSFVWPNVWAPIKATVSLKCNRYPHILFNSDFFVDDLGSWHCCYVEQRKFKVWCWKMGSNDSLIRLAIGKGVGEAFTIFT